MKKIFNIMMATAFGLAVTSCSNDEDFTESIYDTTIEAVDTTATTAPFDQWLYDHFVVPYNTEIQYRFNYPASDLSYQLTPADYKKSQLLSHFIEHLFYDVYNKYGGEDFMKKYGPRIFHYIGSVATNPNSGTEKQGYASAGVKITLINVNNMKLWKEDDEYTPADMDQLNKDQFHVMHHEFSHILHQTKSYPVTFGQVTPGTYDARTWQERDSVESHSLGYLTQYGSSANTEDFVEFLSCTITDTDYRWMTTIIDACLNGGVKDGDKERVYTLIDSLEIENLNDPERIWNNFKIYKEEEQVDGVWQETGRYVPSFHKEDAETNAKATSQTIRLNIVEKEFTSFRDFLDNWVQTDLSENTGGINAILKKLDIATKWYTENWGLYLFEIRREVRLRQNDVNRFVREEVTIYDYQ